jgi:6-pyruvoyltetrahydropterin/6-carboxytetrahydropterin synthase
MIYITRRESFSAAHRMFRKELTDEENFRIFGKCSNPNWHGHNYIMEVTVKGEISESTGFFFNLGTLKSIIKERIIDKVDHRNLNLEVSFMMGKITTTENLAISIWNELKPVIEKEGAFLHCVKIAETENNFVEYYG